jgi:hypothetical protein
MVSGVLLVTVVLCCDHGLTPSVKEYKRNVLDAPLRQSDHSPLPDAILPGTNDTEQTPPRQWLT